MNLEVHINRSIITINISNRINYNIINIHLAKLLPSNEYRYIFHHAQAKSVHNKNNFDATFNCINISTFLDWGTDKRTNGNENVCFINFRCLHNKNNFDDEFNFIYTYENILNWRE